MKRVKIAILISMGLILTVVGLSLWVHFKDQRLAEEENLPRIVIDGADSRLEKIRFVEEKEGKKTWELEAKSMQQYQDQNIMILEDVHLTLFSKEGRSLTVTGRQGKVYQDTKNMEIRGDVVVISSEGYRLKTQSLAYSHQDKKIQTQDMVELDGEQLWMKGRGMLVDLEARTVRVLHEVKTLWKGGREG